MKRLLLLAGALIVGGAAALLRPAVVRTDGGTRLLVLLRGQSGHVRFVNSVTGRPVDIAFRIGTRFSGFEMRTDPGTEEYYTSGLYAVNDVAARESTESLRFCSIEGMHLTLGFHELDVKGGCLEVTLRWTTSSGASRS